MFNLFNLCLYFIVPEFIITQQAFLVITKIVERTVAQGDCTPPGPRGAIGCTPPGPSGGSGSNGGRGPNRWIPPGPNGAIGWIGGLGPIGCIPPGPRGCIGCTPPGPRGSTPQFGRSGQTKNTDERTK